MMPKSQVSSLGVCYLDTTFLVGCLFLPKSETKPYLDRIQKFSQTHIPEYAHKELKLGVVRNFHWFFTKLQDTNSMVDALSALQRSSLSLARYRTATGIQALKTAMNNSLTQLLLARQAGQSSSDSNEKTLARIMALELRRQITSGWNNRLAIGKMVFPLDCYPRQQIDSESDPFTIKPDNCAKGAKCCVFKELKQYKKQAKILKDVISALPPKQEYKRRKDALKQVQLGREFDLKECRAIGDAYFALTCAKDWTLLSTNTKDFAPMAEALKLKSEGLE